MQRFHKRCPLWVKLWLVTKQLTTNNLHSKANFICNFQFTSIFWPSKPKYWLRFAFFSVFFKNRIHCTLYIHIKWYKRFHGGLQFATIYCQSQEIPSYQQPQAIFFSLADRIIFLTSKAVCVCLLQYSV